MTEFMTEQEQIEELKNWLKQYGMTIIAGIILAVIIVSSWHFWQNYQMRKSLKASALYEQLINDRIHNNFTNMPPHADRLIKHYPRTPYASLAALLMASDAANKQNLSLSQSRLQWVVKHSADAGLRTIAQIRLAKTLLATNKLDDALNLLNEASNKDFQALIDEVRGDIYTEQNNSQQARDAYQHALQELPKDELSEAPVLQMKLDNIAVTTSS